MGEAQGFFGQMLGQLGPSFDVALQAFLAGLPQFLLHAFVTLTILLIGTLIYAALTPHRELKLIREGNPAAGISFGAAILGLSLPLAFGMATSLNWADIVLWGGVTVLFQLFAFRFMELVLNGLPKRIRAGDTAAAALLGAVKLSLSFILAAAVTGAPLARG